MRIIAAKTRVSESDLNPDQMIHPSVTLDIVMTATAKFGRSLQIRSLQAERTIRDLVADIELQLGIPASAL